jgi:hypothetical protein
VQSLTPALGYLSAFFERTGQAEAAATVYGAITVSTRRIMGIDMAALADKIHTHLLDEAFQRCVATGQAMNVGETVRYARGQIDHVRRTTATTQL